MIIDPVTGKGMATGNINESDTRDAFYGGIMLAIRMHLIPTVLSTLPVIRQLSLHPSEIWSLMRSVTMVQSGVGSIRHFVETVKKIESPRERVELVAGAVFSAPLFYLLEKLSPVGLGVNPVLLADMGLMRFVGLAQKFSAEHGLEQTKHLKMMEAIETGITGAFAAESAHIIVDKVSKADLIRAMVNEVSLPDVLIPALQNREYGKQNDGKTAERYKEAWDIYQTLEPNREYQTMDKILEKAIITYEVRTGKRPVWVQSPTYQDWDTIGNNLTVNDPALMIQKMRSISAFPDSVILEHTITSLPLDIQNLISNELTSNYYSWHDVAASPSANGLPQETDTIIRSRDQDPFLAAVSRHIPFDPSTNTIIGFTFSSASGETYTSDRLVQLALIQREFTLANQFVSDERTATGKPVELDRILTHFMESRNGRIDQALWLISQYLEFHARNDPETAEYGSLIKNAQWYIDNINDTLSVGPKWNDMGNLPNVVWRADPDYPGAKDMEVVNQVGLGYHAFSQLALLSHAPPELVKLMVAGRQQAVFGAHGSMKTRADLQHSQELDRANQLLNVFSSPPPKDMQNAYTREDGAPADNIRIYMMLDKASNI